MQDSKVGCFHKETGQLLKEGQANNIKRNEYISRKKELEVKFESNDINLEELIELMNKLKISKNIKIKYEEFLVKNIRRKKPKDLKMI